MKSNYPILSQELRDEIEYIYEMQLYILGYTDTSGLISYYSGINNIIDSSGIIIFASGYSQFENLNPTFGKCNYIINQSESN